MIAELYLIVFLHQTTTVIILKVWPDELYLIVFLHQTTTRVLRQISVKHCILSSFYIKPQQLHPFRSPTRIVSYRLSTSNHNSDILIVVTWWLYLIVFLHQTTTLTEWCPRNMQLYLIVFLHQTTTALSRMCAALNCILSSFYIKPQPLFCHPSFCVIVSYRLSTSNHNRGTVAAYHATLYLIVFLHQTTT